MTNVRRGGIWLVDLDPIREQEIQKTRPAMIISSNMLGAIASELIEITEWREKIAQLLHCKRT